MIRIMKRILTYFSFLIIFIGLIGCSALHNAVRRGDIDEVRTLLDKGDNVNKISANETPLMLAVYCGNIDIVKILVEKGADVNLVPDKYIGNSPLSYAIRYNKPDIAKYLIEHGADIDKAIWALKVSEVHNPGMHTDEIELLQEYKKNIASASNKNNPKVQKLNKPKIQYDIDTPPLFVEDDNQIRDNDIAIVIGIEKYQSLPKSDYSKNDAMVVKDYLKALGFQERNIELITDEKATKSAIEKSIEAWLPNRVKKDSRIIVYYSGHGTPEPKTGDAYIVPFDGDPSYLEITGYSLNRLYEKLGKLKVKEIIILLDSCFSGAGGRSVLAQGARPLVIMTDIKSIPSNIAVISAAQGTQISTSSPEKRHGVFTYYLLKALKEGKKDIAEIYEYIKPLVEDEAKKLNVQQSPSIIPDVEKVKGKFILRK